MLARHRAPEDQTATQQSGAAPTQRFPLSYRDGFTQWWNNLTPAQTEHKVLSYVPYLQKPPTHTQTGSEPPSTNASTMSVDKSPDKAAKSVRTTSITDPYGPREWHSKLVQLAGTNRFLNEFSVERVGEETKNSFVMLHGYGAGLGFFYKNFEALSRLPHWKLYALDLLGMGRSSRPPFRIRAKDKEEKVREAESWFVDALEEWRIKKGIDKMTLLGHSLGGYMAVCYALKYPGHLNKLILASPVGIPEDPYAVNEDLPEPTDGAAQSEFQQDQDKPPRRQLPKWVRTLWDANISPFTFVRLAGPIGPRLVSGWTTRRFAHLPPEEGQALHDYSYSIFRQRASGEYALAYVLAPGAFARSPLIRRIEGVGRQYIQPATASSTANNADAASLPRRSSELERETGVPVVFIYGDKDWMDADGGRASVERMVAERKKALKDATPQERERDNGDAKVKIIRNAGHHVYLDGWEEFNELMVNEMKDVERRQEKLAKLEK